MSDFPVTPLLQQYLALAPSGTNPTVFLRQISISFGERMDPTVVRRAWDMVAKATPSLSGSLSGDESTQGVWTEQDWVTEPPSDLGSAWAELLSEDARRPFEAGVTQRIVLLRLPDQALHLLWTSDSRAMDYGSASGTLIRWFAACDLLMSGNSVDWPGDEDPSEFLAQLSARSTSAEQEFWNARFRDLAGPLNVTLLPLPEADTEPGRDVVSFTFERVDRLALRDGADAMDAPMSGIGRAAWALLLAEACGGREVILADEVQADPESILAQTAGRFESILPRRIQLPTKGDVGAFARACADWELGDERFATYEEIAAAARIPVDYLSPSAAFIFRDGSLNDTLQRALPRWMAADVCVYEKAVHPLTLTWTDSDRPVAEIGYDPSLISRDAAAGLLRRWVHLVNQFAAQPDLSISQVSLALPGEHMELQGMEVPGAARSLVPQCIHEAFGDVANELGDRFAVEVGDESIAYSKIVSQSNQLARYLTKIGVKSTETVAVAIGRTPWWIVSLLGTWKAGARVLLVSDSNSEAIKKVSAVLVDADTAASIETADGVKRIAIDSNWSAIGGEKTRGASQSVEPKSVALVFVNPDGTETTLTHSEFLASCYATSDRLGLTAEDRVLQFGQTDTAAGVEEALSALLAGATLVLRPDDVWSTRTAFHEFLAEARISALILPTAFWGMWLHYLAELSAQPPEGLRVLALSGWRVLPDALEVWKTCAPEIELLHTTLWKGVSGLGFCRSLNRSDTLPFGSIAEPVTARIVNPAGVPLPVGFGGKVELSLPCEKSSERRFEDSGLKAFWSPDGRLISSSWLAASLGRMTTTHPAARIEWVASAHPGIATAVADVRNEEGESSWCVWMVPKEILRGEPLDFRDWLAQHLPAELLPKRIGCLQRLPLDRFGAVDFAALPEPNSELPAPSPSQSRGSDEEEQLRTVLGKVLGGRNLRLDEMIRDGKLRPQVAQSMLDVVSQSGYAAELSDFTSPFSVRSLLRSVRSRKTVTDNGWVPLKPLRASGSQSPLILIHDFAGNSKVCESLAAALGDDQPCYAITSRGLADPVACHQSVEEMADAYVEAILALDPEGPHGLVGIGFGGLIAFEMARRLEEFGTSPRFIALLRTEPPVASVARRGLRAVSQGFFKTLRGWSGSGPAAVGGDPNRRKTGPNPVLESNREAAAKYTPNGVSRFEMHVFTPEKDFPPFKDVQAGWNAFCSEVNYYQVPCSASELLDEPAVSAVGTALAKLARYQELEDDADVISEDSLEK